MISKKDIIEMARSVTKRSQGYQEKQTIQPQREWFIGVGLFILIAVAGGIFNAREHVYYNSIENSIEVTTAPTKEYKDKAAQLARSIYDQRAAEFNRLSASASVVSLPVVTASSSEEVASSTEAVLPVESDDEREEDVIGNSNSPVAPDGVPVSE